MENTDTLFKKAAEDCAFGLILNMNDVFGWGLADAEQISIDDFATLLPLYQTYGFDTFVAYASIRRDEAPQDRYPTNDNFRQVRELVQELVSKDKILFDF